ncbi:MAG: hypothetical protein L0Y55_19115, partial [Anaerolineales bacterium]|nr:hypothetical protein [Anaerolineales bacterium]
NYHLAQTPGGFHLGLITKFEIVETENLSAEVGRQGVLRAKLLSPDGKSLNVFIVHLDPASAETRLCEVNALIRLMQPYTAQWTLLLGDLNFQPRSREFQRLEQAGWKTIAVEPSWGIDHIWVWSGLAWSDTTWFRSVPAPRDISDHNPIGAELAIHSAAGPVLPITRPAPLPLPAFVANALTDARALRFDGLDDPCASSQWTSRWKTEKVSNGVLEINGEEPWQAFATRYKEFAEGQGILVRFQFTHGAEIEFDFDNAGWNTDRYRRFGVHISNDRARAILWQGLITKRSERLSDDPDFAPETWYTLLLALGKNGEFRAQIWDSADPARVVKYRGQLDALSPGLPWMFRIGANRGTVLIDSVTEIVFGALKD